MKSRNFETDKPGAVPHLIYKQHMRKLLHTLIALICAATMHAQTAANSMEADTVETDSVETLVIDRQVSPELRIMGLVVGFAPAPTDRLPELARLFDGSTAVRAVSITPRRGVAIHGDAQHTDSRLPRAVANALGRLHATGARIDDVSITDHGWWAITHDGNSFEGEVPQSLETTLDSLTALGQRILSVSIARGGDYAYATSGAHGASDYHFALALDEAARLLGQPTSVCQTDCGLLAVCPKGVYMLGVPVLVAEALTTRPELPAAVRFTDDGMFVILYPDGTNTYYF